MSRRAPGEGSISYTDEGRTGTCLSSGWRGPTLRCASRRRWAAEQANGRPPQVPAGHCAEPPGAFPDDRRGGSMTLAC